LAWPCPDYEAIRQSYLSQLAIHQRFHIARISLHIH